jgi:hypothetical protein
VSGFQLGVITLVFALEESLSSILSSLSLAFPCWTRRNLESLLANSFVRGLLEISNRFLCMDGLPLPCTKIRDPIPVNEPCRRVLLIGIFRCLDILRRRPKIFIFGPFQGTLEPSNFSNSLAWNT